MLLLREERGGQRFCYPLWEMPILAFWGEMTAMSATGAPSDARLWLAGVGCRAMSAIVQCFLFVPE
jgi:hypothetical protein